jgi:hypothetical protein
MASRRYEVFHGDGGHCGPYADFNTAEASARVSAKRQARLRDCGAGSARIAQYDAEAPGGYLFTHRVNANRCRSCDEIHVCIEPA